MQGRPNFGVGLTNSGDVLGGTMISFADVLGDQMFNIQAYSIQTYRTYGASYVNLAGRLQYALQGISSEQYFYGLGAYFAPSLAFLSRDDAIATRRSNGGSAIGIYPIDRFRRFEFSAGVYNFKETFANEALQAQSDAFQQQQFGTTLFRDGSFMPFGTRFFQETTVFREYGPVAGNTLMAGYEYAPGFGGFLSRQTIDFDARYYLRIAENGVLAFRGRAFNSWGDFPDFIFFGGQSEMRGYEYLHFLGHKAVSRQRGELRFPLVEAIGDANRNPRRYPGYLLLQHRGRRHRRPAVEPVLHARGVGAAGNRVPRELPRQRRGAGVPSRSSVRLSSSAGFRLNNARASYGFGLTTFAIGFPIHLDWSWPTLFNEAWEDTVFATEAQYAGFLRGSDYFRKVRFSLWIGYDF